MHTLAVCMKKGGAGKTTTVVALARCFARRGLRVLVIDLDGQGHATALLTGEAARSRGTRELMLEGADLTDVAVEGLDGVSVCGANETVAQIEIVLAAEVARETFLREGIQASPRWDLVLLDCPPNPGLMTVNALVAADSVLTPLTPSYLSMRSVAAHESILEKVRSRLNPSLEHLGYVLCAVDSRKGIAVESREVLAQHVERAGLLLHVVRTDTQLETHEPAWRSKGMQDYDALAEKLHARLPISNIASAA